MVVFILLISGQQSVNLWREAISIRSGKFKRFTFVHPVEPVCKLNNYVKPGSHTVVVRIPDLDKAIH